MNGLGKQAAIDRRSSASMSESKPSAMYRHSTRLVGLRRSLASYWRSAGYFKPDELSSDGIALYGSCSANVAKGWRVTLTTRAVEGHPSRPRS